jgi:VanZ family protein
MAVRLMMKVCSAAAILLLVLVALGPSNWQPRTGLGWEMEHFLGYFLFTLLFCLAWPRPLVVGGTLTVFSVLLEGLQALTPDRSANLRAALYGAGGVVVAALLAQIFIRARQRLAYRSALTPGKPPALVNRAASSEQIRATGFEPGC